VALLLHFEFQHARLAAQAQHLADAGRAGVAVRARVACERAVCAGDGDGGGGGGDGAAGAEGGAQAAEGGASGGAEGGERLEAVCAGCGVHFCGVLVVCVVVLELMMFRCPVDEFGVDMEPSRFILECFDGKSGK
jgi:hypothetical protein